MIYRQLLISPFNDDEVSIMYDLQSSGLVKKSWTISKERDFPVPGGWVRGEERGRSNRRSSFSLHALLHLMSEILVLLICTEKDSLLQTLHLNLLYSHLQKSTPSRKKTTHSQFTVKLSVVTVMDEICFLSSAISFLAISSSLSTAFLE